MSSPFRASLALLGRRLRWRSAPATAKSATAAPSRSARPCRLARAPTRSGPAASATGTRCQGQALRQQRPRDRPRAAAALQQMNCVGCHCHGGGGMGPPLMDDEWRYGGRHRPDRRHHRRRPAQRHAGLARQADRDQIWQLAAYVRSLSGQPSKDAVSSRADEMSTTRRRRSRRASRRTRRTPPSNEACGVAQALHRSCRCSSAAATTSTTRASSANAGAGTQHFMTLFTIFLVVCAVMYALVIAFLIASLVGARRPLTRTSSRMADTDETAPALRTALIGLGRTGDRPRQPRNSQASLTDRSDRQAAGQREAARSRSPATSGGGTSATSSADASKTHSAPRTSCTFRSDVPVRIFLKSNDVIHSFWVPNLAGKQDLIPGRAQCHHPGPPSRSASIAANAPNLRRCSMPTWRSSSMVDSYGDFDQLVAAPAAAGAAARRRRWRSRAMNM